MNINEATFEARLNEELRRLFPTLEPTMLSHQKVLKLRLGRQTKLLDAKQTLKLKGRYDILLELNRKPIAIFELKRPGSSLTTEDRDQGISYARLLTPMPPLVVISNGSDTEFYKTYDKQPWNPEDLSEEKIQKLIRSGSECALMDKDEAVKSLLGQNPDIWSDVIRKYTSDQLKSITGGITNAGCPIAESFQIKRSATDKLIKLLSDEDAPLIVLTGPALCGKTNVVKQLIEKLQGTHIVPLYLNYKQISHDPIRHLSNVFCRELFFNITAQDVRLWLINSLNNLSEYRLLIIIDEIYASNTKAIESKIYDLIYLSENNKISILLSLDENLFDEISRNPGRETMTEFGKRAKAINIRSLNDEETKSAFKEIKTRFKLSFNTGAFFNYGLRNPRILRVLVAEVISDPLYSHSEIMINQFDKVGRLPSITGFHILDVVWRWFLNDPELRNDYRLLAKAHILDMKSRQTDPSIIVLSHGRGHLTWETTESILGVERFKRLKGFGYLKLIKGPKGTILVLPTIPEMLSAAAVFIIANNARMLYEKGKINEAYEYVINSSSPLPLGDVVGGMSIIEMYKSNPDTLSYFIERLIVDRPKVQKVVKMKKGMIYLPDVGEIEVSIPPGAGGELIGNTEPWLIMSHLAHKPMSSDFKTPDIFFKILATVGSFPNILIRPEDNATDKIKGFHVHEFKGRGTCVCGQMGIVEPITDAIFDGFHIFPNYMGLLAKWAADNDILPLAFRIMIAARFSITSVDEKVSNAAHEAINSLKEYLSDFLEHLV